MEWGLGCSGQGVATAVGNAGNGGLWVGGGLRDGRWRGWGMRAGWWVGNEIAPKGERAFGEGTCAGHGGRGRGLELGVSLGGECLTP